MIYLDSSAIVTLVTRRAPFAELAAFVKGCGDEMIATSTIGIIESVRTSDTIGCFPGLLRDLAAQYVELDVTAGVRDNAALLPGRIRTLDAVHVVTAQAIGASLQALVTYDKRMIKIARLVGLPVVSPGQN